LPYEPVEKGGRDEGLVCACVWDGFDFLAVDGAGYCALADRVRDCGDGGTFGASLPSEVLVGYIPQALDRGAADQRLERLVELLRWIISPGSFETPQIAYRRLESGPSIRLLFRTHASDESQAVVRDLYRATGAHLSGSRVITEPVAVALSAGFGVSRRMTYNGRH
jgi:hypothetical protein